MKAVKITSTTVTTVGSIEQRSVTYNSSYAQVTPSIGYKLMKKMSIGVGPDFQQMLGDNRPVEARPVEATGYRGNVQEAPSFDIGFVENRNMRLPIK